MNLGARTAAWYGGDLPAGCRHVKYLWSNGNQYIKTGVQVKADYVWTVDIQRLNGSGYCGIYHQDTSGTYRRFDIIGSNESVFYFAIGDWVSMGVSADNLRHTWVLDNKNGKCLLDSNEFSATGSGYTFKATGSPFLFARCGGGGRPESYGYFKIWSSRFDSDDGIVQDLIPIVASVNGIDNGFMYDRVSKTYLPYGNKGSGAFGWEELDGTIVSPT